MIVYVDKQKVSHLSIKKIVGSTKRGLKNYTFSLRKIQTFFDKLKELIYIYLVTSGIFFEFL